MPVSQAVVICGFGELGQTVSSFHQAVHDHLLHKFTGAAAQSDPQLLHARKGSQLAVKQQASPQTGCGRIADSRSAIAPQFSMRINACRWPTCWSLPWR